MVENTPPILEQTHESEEEQKNQTAIQRMAGALTSTVADFGEKTKTSIEQAMSSATNKTVKGIVGSALGPISALAKPLEGFFGFDLGEQVAGIFKRDKNKKEGKGGLFGLGTPFKGAINRNKVKEIDPGAVLISDALSGSQTDDMEDQQSGLGGFLSGLLGLNALRNLPGGLLGTLLKASPFLALAGGILWGVMDGIAGMAKAEEWGVSDVAGFIGGFLGGTGKGWSNAFKNAGKWALMGAGGGFLVAGPVGAIVGGLVGAAIGGVLGYFGGEKIAQGLQSVWDSLMEIPFFSNLRDLIVETVGSLWDLIKSPFVGIFEGIMGANRLGDIWGDADKSVGEKIGETLANIWEMSVAAVIGGVTGLITGLGNYFLDFFVGKKDAEGERTERSIMQIMIDMMIALGSGIGDFFKGLFSGLFKSIENLTLRAFDAAELIRGVVQQIGVAISGAFSRAVDIASRATAWVEESVIDPIGRFFGGVATSIWEFVTNAVTTANNWVIENITTPVGAFFSRVAGGIRSAWDTVSGFIQQRFIWPIRDFFGNIGSFFEAFRNKSFREVVEMLAGQATGRDTIQESINERNEERLRSVARQHLGGTEGIRYMTDEGVAKALIDRGIYFPGVTDHIDDAIITKDGQIIRTHPDDHIIATQSPVSMVGDREMSRELGRMNSRHGEPLEETLINELRNFMDTIKNNAAVAVQNNNFSSPFAPHNMMRSPMTEVI